MPYTTNTITSIFAPPVGAGGSATFRPAAREAWLVKSVGSQNAFVTNVPDIEIHITDGALDTIAVLDPTTDPGKHGRPYRFYLTHDTYMTVTNTGGAGANISVVGEQANFFNVISDVLAIGVGATIEIDPGTGQDWVIHEIGGSVWTAGPADINPNLTIGGIQGALTASVLLNPTMVRGQDKELDLYISHTTHLYVTDTGGAGCNVSFSGVKAGKTVISVINDVGAGGDLDIRPPDGQEWVITDFAAETWAGAGAPNNYPNCAVSIRTAAVNSDLLKAGAPSEGWNRKMALNIDHTNYLRIHNAAGGNNEICVFGFLERAYL